MCTRSRLACPMVTGGSESDGGVYSRRILVGGRCGSRRSRKTPALTRKRMRGCLSDTLREHASVAARARRPWIAWVASKVAPSHRGGSTRAESTRRYNRSFRVKQGRLAASGMARTPSPPPPHGPHAAAVSNPDPTPIRPSPPPGPRSRPSRPRPIRYCRIPMRQGSSGHQRTE